MAHGHAEGVVKPHAALGQRVDVRRFPALAAVGADGFAANVIGHDEQDIRLALGHGGNRYQSQKRKQDSFHCSFSGIP